jgi:acetoacetate decarboxylase
MKTADLVQDAFAMPVTSPSFPRAPYRYSNRERPFTISHTDRAESVS